MVTILHPFTSPITPDQKPTWDWFKDHEAILKRLDYDVKHVPCGPGPQIDGDYEHAVKELWKQAKDDLMIVESDIVPTMGQLTGMKHCDHLVCSMDYPIFVAKTKLANIGGKTVYVQFDQPAWHSHLRIFEDRRWHYLEQDTGDKRAADISGLGCIKISKRVMEAFPPCWPNGSWMDLDNRISFFLRSKLYRFHIHQPPVIHNRKAEWHPPHIKIGDFEIETMQLDALPIEDALDLVTSYDE